MNCFFSFKGERRRNRKKAESAPELRNPSVSSVSPKRQAKSANSASSSKSIPELYMERHQNLRVFNLEELKQATNNFNKMLKIGQGGFGSVYKGRIRPVVGGNPVAVAIKRLNKNGWQGEKEWVAEVHFLGVVDHPNLVRLMGYCSEEGERGIQRLLVYEYMRHRSLDDHLFDDSHSVQKPLHLPWKIRLHIMLGAAQGLAYLHQGPLQVQVIFRDFKSSNVLLDDNLNAKLSDFGLARQGPTGDRTHVSTAPVGTLGYAAPEYVDTGHLNLKSDIYSYGVVLYEILTGRRVLDRNRPTPEQKLLEWVRHFPPDSSRFHLIMDARLRNNYSRPAAIKIAKLAGRCVSKSPSHRPHMNEIVDVLQEAIAESDEVGGAESARGGSKR